MVKLIKKNNDLLPLDESFPLFHRFILSKFSQWLGWQFFKWINYKKKKIIRSAVTPILLSVSVSLDTSRSSC